MTASTPSFTPPPAITPTSQHTPIPSRTAKTRPAARPPTRPRATPLLNARRLLLGASALQAEAQYHRHRRRLAERLAITRAIVILADFFADLIVFDLLHAVATSAHPPAALLSSLTGLSAGILLADAITGVSAHLPPAARAHAAHAAPPDVFHQLVHSCTAVTPGLSLVACWSAAVETSLLSTFVRATAVATLSLIALAPLLSAHPARPDAPLVKLLRRAGFLIRPGHQGWGQICGASDHALQLVFCGVVSVFRRLRVPTR